MIPQRFVDVDLDVVADMVVPPWFQGSMSTEAATLLASEIEGRFMGGDSTRHEQLFRCTGTFRVGDEPELSFTGTGLRIHRVGVRDIGQFWGHTGSRRCFRPERRSD